MLSLVLAPILTFVSPPAPVHSCALPETVQAAQHASAPALRKLGDLPDAEMDLAVIRSIDGCSVREVVRFNVSQSGPGGAATTTIPTPGFTGKLVPDSSVARTTPTR